MEGGGMCGIIVMQIFFHVQEVQNGARLDF